MAIEWKIDEETRTLVIRGRGIVADEKEKDAQIKKPWLTKKVTISRAKTDLTIRHIKIGSGITALGEGAFEGLKNVETVELPKSLKRIGKNAFD